jgi:hypothetical protein
MEKNRPDGRFLDGKERHPAHGLSKTVHPSDTPPMHMEVKQGPQDESPNRDANEGLRGHHDRLRAAHAKVEHLGDAVTCGHSHITMRESSQQEPQAGETAQPQASPRHLARELVKSLQGKVALQIGVSGYVSVVREGKAPRAWQICAGESLSEASM